jgi:hypothetical protein
MELVHTLLQTLEYGSLSQIWNFIGIQGLSLFQ